MSTKVEGDKTSVTVAVQESVLTSADDPSRMGKRGFGTDGEGQNLKTVFSDKRVYGRTYADAKGQKDGIRF